MSMFQLRLNSIVRSLPGILRWMGEHPFLSFLILLFLALLISGLVFYQYVFTVQDDISSNEIVQTRFNQQAFQQVMQIWREREEKFNQAGGGPGRNIFVPSVD